MVGRYFKFVAVAEPAIPELPHGRLNQRRVGVVRLDPIGTHKFPAVFPHEGDRIDVTHLAEGQLILAGLL